MKKIFRTILKTIKWTLLVFVALALISAAYNLTLPEHSEIVEHLSEKEKAYIAETMNLQQKLGSEVWPGWGELHIPVIVYNEAYAFLIGYPDPPAGWYKMPAEEFRGTDWKIVESDDFFGKNYYRQALPNPDITPENFTVKVGDRWVTAMQTKEYAAVAFYNGFKNELPPMLNAIFPYKIFWNMLMGKAENYIGGMAHEAFHAFQGTVVPMRLAEGEYASRLSSDYPWEIPENAEAWIEETNRLLTAYHAENNDEAKQLVAQFINIRRERRVDADLSGEMIEYEQKREWLEGLAKYAELKIGLCAEESKAYSPIAEITEVSGFKNYNNRTIHFDRQIEEVKRTAARSGESRFYYVGMLQAVLLDRLMPEWKSTAFDEDIYLEDLLGNIN